MKKIIIAALTAIMALSVFTGCAYKADTFTSEEMKSYPVKISEDTAKVGYGLTVKVGEESTVITAAGYSQSAIALPFQGFPKAEIELSTTGKTTIGFLAAGASPWDGRIADKDIYKDTPLAMGKIKVDVPAEAAFITFGSNGEDSVITIKSITLCAE